jgi:hypothetical protein
MFNKILLLLLLIPFFTFSQVTNSGKPISWKVEQTNTEKIILPDFDLKQLQNEDALNDEKGDAPFRFGYEHQVDIDINTHGNWTNLPDGSRYWLINIASANAKTMNFLFDEFYLPKGAKLYFYNSDRSDVLGAYTHTQNREDKQFGSWLVDGDNIYIELYEPAEKLGETQLHMSRAIHGYRSVADFTDGAKGLNDSGACNLDVDCSVGADFDSLKEELKKSVGLIVVGGSGFCTGSLINNTSNNGTPYFLTANHCLGGSVANWAFRFNWTSPNPQCATFTNSTNGSFDQTVSGAALRASNSISDVALLEITAPLPSSWDLVWAGWDRSGAFPSYNVGIHHPSGDIMKVCRNDNPLQKTQTFFNGNPNTSVWLVDNWELGVTEPGSSGSALFDQDGRIIGQLAGGQAACSGTSDNNQFDIYGRFGVSWDSGSSQSSRLKEWLDPNDTGDIVIDQYPSLQIFNNDAKLLVSNVPQEVCEDEVQPLFEVQNNGIQPITSINFTYQVNSDTPVSITWTGNISTGEIAFLEAPILPLDDGVNIIIASLDSPNGMPDELTGNNSIQQDVFRTLSYNTTSINLTINTDDYGNETTWEFLDENGNILDQGGPYNDNITVLDNFIVNTDMCYSFTIYDSADDGICCGFGLGDYELSTSDGNIIFSGGDFASQETTNMSITDDLNINVFEESNISIYPNPADDVLNIESKYDNLSYELFDVTGKLILNFQENQIRIGHLSRGIYLLKVKSENLNQFVTKKIIVE